MRPPCLSSVIERRLLVNYRVDPEAAAALLPSRRCGNRRLHPSPGQRIGTQRHARRPPVPRHALPCAVRRSGDGAGPARRLRESRRLYAGQRRRQHGRAFPGQWTGSRWLPALGGWRRSRPAPFVPPSSKIGAGSRQAARLSTAPCSCVKSPRPGALRGRCRSPPRPARTPLPAAEGPVRGAKIPLLTG